MRKVASRRADDERGTSNTFKKRGVLLPEVTYPWTVSCLEYGIAR